MGSGEILDGPIPCLRFYNSSHIMLLCCMYLYLIYEYIVVSLISEDRNILAQAEAPAGFVSVAATTQIFFSLHFFD